MWDSIIAQLTKYQHFIISSHVNPDCDALGSELALAYHLKSLEKTVTILNSDQVPSIYQFLDPENLIQAFSSKKHSHILADAEVIIVLDVAGGWRRLGRVGTPLSEVDAVTICIDHHPDDKSFTHFSYVDTNVIAAGELVFDLIHTMGGDITPLMAQALYAAILTDSGNFRFPKTSAQTHRITARLLECGADHSKIYKLLYQQYSLSKLHIKGHVLKNIQVTANGQIAYVAITKQLLRKFSITLSELDGFSSLAQQIAGVRVAIFVVELPRNRVKISLRSDGTVTVNQLAAFFGGGGHAPAAGAIASGELDDVLARLIEEAEKLL